jgi:hypothetical protein
MMFLTQQTTTTEMMRLTKSPSMIEKTQLMQWKTILDGFRFFVGLFDPDLPFFFSIADIFCGVDWLFFVMVSSMNDCLK